MEAAVNLADEESEVGVHLDGMSHPGGMGLVAAASKMSADLTRKGIARGIRAMTAPEPGAEGGA